MIFILEITKGKFKQSENIIIFLTFYNFLNNYHTLNFSIQFINKKLLIMQPTLFNPTL